MTTYMCINTRLPKNWNPTLVRLPKQRKREGYLVKRIKISLKSEKMTSPHLLVFILYGNDPFETFLSFFKPFKTPILSHFLSIFHSFLLPLEYEKSYPCKKNYRVKFLYISFYSNILLIFHFSLCSWLRISYEVQ